MRATVLGIALGVTLAAQTARAQCQDAGVPIPDGGCGTAFTLTIAPLTGITGIPVLEIDAVVQDDGSMIGSPTGGRGGTVFVVVTGPSDGGGGTLILPDGGASTLGGPFTAPLYRAGYDVDGGVFTSYWDGGTSLFLGDNTIVVSAVQPSGAHVESAPQLVRLDLSFDGGTADAGVDGGTGVDAGVTDAGSSPDGGIVTDGGQSNDAGQSSPGTGGQAPDGGAAAGDAGGCSTTAGGPPSFLLMALGVMLAALGRRAMRG